MKHLVCIVSFMIFSLGLCANNKEKVDSLITTLESTKDGQARLDVLADLCYEIVFTDPKAGINYGREMMDLSKELPTKSNLMKASLRYASVLYQNGIEMDSVAMLTNRALDYSEEIGDETYEMYAHFLLGKYERTSGEFDQAVYHYLEIVKKMENTTDPNMKQMVGKAYHGIGIVKDNQKKPKEALENFEKTLVIGEELNDKDLMFLALESTGISYAMSGDMEKALKYFKQARKQVKYTISESNILGNIALAFTYMNELDSAEHYNLKVVEVLKENGSNRQKVNALGPLIKLYFKKKEYPKALEALQTRDSLVQLMDSKKWKRSSFKGFSQYYEEVGDFKKALSFHKLYMQANDSVINESNQEKINELETKFEVEKDKAQIQAQQVEITKKEGQRNSLLIGMGLLSILAVLLFYFMRKRNQRNKLIAEQKAQLAEQKIKDLEQERKMLSMSAMLEGQESERSRIAKDLHDGLGGLLSSIKAHFGMIQSEIQKIESLNVYDKAQGMMDNACEEVRRISHNLMPPLLRSQGLAATIGNLVANINTTSDVQVKLDQRNNEKRLSETQETFLYRITQELLNNILKHAEATEVEVCLYGLEDSTQLIVEDNGKGFDTAKASSGLGLSSIKSRVDYLNGELDIESAIGEGTTISVTIPSN